MLDLGKRAVVGQRLQLGGQFAGDLFDRFGVEDCDGLRKRTKRGARAAEFLLYSFEFAGLLNAAQRRDDGVEQEQQNVGAVVVEEELAIAGAIALSADVVQAFQQRHQPVEVLQTDNVAVAQLALFSLAHALNYAQTPCRAQEQWARKSWIFCERAVAQILCRTGLDASRMALTYSAPVRSTQFSLCRGIIRGLRAFVKVSGRRMRSEGMESEPHSRR
jgi:hypothetical protein